MVSSEAHFHQPGDVPVMGCLGRFITAKKHSTDIHEESSQLKKHNTYGDHGFDSFDVGMKILTLTLYDMIFLLANAITRNILFAFFVNQ